MVETKPPLTIIQSKKKNEAKEDEELDLTEAQVVLKRIKDDLGEKSVLLLYWDLPNRSEKLKDEKIDSEYALRKLSDEKLAAWGFSTGLIDQIRNILDEPADYGEQEPGEAGMQESGESGGQEPVEAAVEQED